MNRKIRLLGGTCTFALLLIAALSPVRGDSQRPGGLPNRLVAIDGKSFLSGGPGQDDFSTVARAFEKFGAKIPRFSGRPPVARNRHPVFRGGISMTEGVPAGNTMPQPPGLTADHILRLETAPGGVDLVLGRMNSRGPSIRHRLVADGWEAAGEENAAGSTRVLERKSGKETAIVCLDEAEGTFLLVRESGR
jgi:hypothetical protein